MKWFAYMLVLGCLWLPAQDRPVELDIYSGQPVRLYNIAVPDFKSMPGAEDYRDAVRVINEVVRADLRNSGMFRVLGKDRLNLIRSPHDGPLIFEDWGSIEAAHLAVGRVLREGDQMKVEIRLFEIASKQAILAKAVTGKPKLARKIAHTVSDYILTHLFNSKFATSKIVYTKRRRSTVDPSRTLDELYIMDYDGYNELPITRGGLVFSPDAKRVGRDIMLIYGAFQNAFTMNATYTLQLKPSLASRPRPLLEDPSRRAQSPSISPDGRKVAFSIAKDGNSDIWVMNLDGSDAVQLTRHPGIDTNPSWAPGGRSLLFTSDRTGTPQIYRMDADGLNRVLITTQNSFNDSAKWNPRYDYMAYVSRFENDFDIFIMNLQTRENYRVTEKSGSNEEPHWSPDGEQLCFTSNRSGTWQIYAINRNGTNLRRITSTGNNREPVWIE
ncbi:MAG: hypothetical protein QNK37_18565 [Acidobacteriota bacterium]|nr:hypothetical protein [Acidobacteriota bacterium]